MTIKTRGWIIQSTYREDKNQKDFPASWFLGYTLKSMQQISTKLNTRKCSPFFQMQILYAYIFYRNQILAETGENQG